MAGEAIFDFLATLQAIQWWFVGAWQDLVAAGRHALEPPPTLHAIELAGLILVSLWLGPSLLLRLVELLRRRNRFKHFKPFVAMLETFVDPDDRVVRITRGRARELELDVLDYPYIVVEVRTPENKVRRVLAELQPRKVSTAFSDDSIALTPAVVQKLRLGENLETGGSEAVSMRLRALRPLSPRAILSRTILSPNPTVQLNWQIFLFSLLATTISSVFISQYYYVRSGDDLARLLGSPPHSRYLPPREK